MRGGLHIGVTDQLLGFASRVGYEVVSVDPIQVRADGSVIKNAEYSQDRLIGKVCEYYDGENSHYKGNVDGFDQREVTYSLTPIAKFGATQKLPITPKK